MAEYDLKFTASPLTDTGTYKLLELPPELCSLIESAGDSDSSPGNALTIKGQAHEDAVLCTQDKTYALRSVVLSNSVLVVAPPPHGGGDPSREVVIRDQLNEILELVPSVPRLHTLEGLLKGQAYDEGQEGEGMARGEDGPPVREPAPRVSYKEAQATVQASDTELARGLKDRRVLSLEGNLRPVAPSYLTAILELLLNEIVSQSLHGAAPVEALSSALARDHELKREVCEQVMAWFGRVEDGKWEMDAAAVVREIGLGVLRTHKDKPIPRWEFVMNWRKKVVDTFESIISLELLSGNYLINFDTLQDPPLPLVTYFPCSSLPIDPAARFADLFLTRARWKAEEIEPYLTDIAVDRKERDKLLLKFARAVTNAEGVWYTARAKYNG
ncbi:sister chromatid cohesion protein Dcc1 [Amylocystis lapponica]|nr:sister chromatid cohesion protein Dcc1 [Amylocystis lapponica]